MISYKRDENSHLPRVQSPYKKQLAEIAKMANYEPIASIPGLNNGFNFTVAEDGLLRKKIKSEVHCESPIEERRNQKNQGKLPKISGKANRFQHHPTNVSDNCDRFLTVDTRQDTEQLLIVNSRANSPVSVKRSAEKKKKPSIRYKLKALEEESEYSDESDGEYSTNATPGPGYYSVNSSTFFNQSQQSRPASDFSFGSKASRFRYSVQEQSNFEMREQQVRSKEKEAKRERNRIYREKKIIPFLSGVKKEVSPVQKVNLNVPGPQDYHPRHGIEEELIKRIQRNFKGNFGTCQERFKQKARQSHLGPGCYNSTKINPEQQQNNASYFFASQKKRF